MGLQALQTKSTTGLSGTITVYDLAGKIYLTKDLIFTADTIYAPHLSLPKNTVYRLIIVFYYDATLPIAFLDEDITVGAEASYSFTLHKENVHFSLSEITDTSALLSLSADVDTGILPDLDLDDDGFSNIVEYRGGSDPRDDTSIPHGPDFDSIDVEYAADGNLVTITVELSDGNYVTSIEPSVSNYGYLQRGGIFTEDLSGDDLDRERTYTLSFNPQYAPIGEITLNFTATNSIDLVSTDSVILDIVDNGENVGPVIVFDSLSADQVVGGDVEVAMTAYDRDTITSLDLTSPTSITDTASEAAYFVGNWDTGSQHDGDFTVIATAEDLLGEVTTRRLAISINNGSDGSGPGLQMNIYNAYSTALEIDYLNGDTVFGVAPFRVTANDASDVSYIQLTNLSDLNCSGADLSDCPLTDHSAGLDDFITSNSAYTNSFDTTSYDDGDQITMTYLTGDSHGSTSERTFTFAIKNAPTINTVSTSSTTVTSSGEVTITWGVEDRTTAVYVLDAEGTNVTCDEGVALANDGQCTFTPSASQAYTVRAAYAVENQYGEVQTFYTDQATDTVHVDYDDDGVFDEEDNCIRTMSTDQTDSDEDGYGDLCDPDQDGDGYADSSFDFATFYTDYVGTEVTAANQEYATLYTSTSYAGTNDCDDTITELSPGAREKLNGVDDDCDASVDQIDFGHNKNIYFEDGIYNRIVGEAEYDHLGYENIQISDLSIDSDGQGEFVTIAREANSYGGAAYFFWSETTLTTTRADEYADATSADFKIYGDADANERLSHIRTLDFNGDGDLDLLIALPYASYELSSVNHKYAGRITIVFGIESLIADLLSIDVNEISTNEFIDGGMYESRALSFYGGYHHSTYGYGYDYLGQSVDVGDVDGDGRDDILAGMPGYFADIDTRDLRAGGVALIRGTTNYCTNNCEYFINPSSTNKGVLNINDLEPYSAGLVNVLWGSNRGDQTAKIVELADVSGDGLDDVLVVAANYDEVYDTDCTSSWTSASCTNTNEGKVSIVMSGATIDGLQSLSEADPAATPDYDALSAEADLQILGDAAGDRLGSMKYSGVQTSYEMGHTLAVDAEGNLYIGTPNAESNNGKVYRVPNLRINSLTGFQNIQTTMNDKIWTSTTTDEAFGNSIALCEDMDANEQSELVVAAPWFTEDSAYKGQVYLYNVSDEIGDDFYATQFASLKGIASSAALGSSLSCIDFRGDGGADDLFIGMWGNPQLVTHRGSSYLLPSDY